MCIAVLRWVPEDASPLLLAANRDEFFDRPTREMHWWDGGDVLAGRDLRANGAWMGLTRRGRFALITNVRNPSMRRSGAPSRGHIVQQFLEGDATPEAFVHQLSQRAHEYEGFNLLCGSITQHVEHRAIWFLNSAEARPRRLDAGTYAVSNASLDTPWPKVERIKQGMRHALASLDSETREERLLRLLTNGTKASLRDMPNTGIAPDIERDLSSIFIRRNGYGTRASSVIRLQHNVASVVEVTYSDAQADQLIQQPQLQQRFEFALED